MRTSFGSRAATRSTGSPVTPGTKQREQLPGSTSVEWRVPGHHELGCRRQIQSGRGAYVDNGLTALVAALVGVTGTLLAPIFSQRIVYRVGRDSEGTHSGISRSQATGGGEPGEVIRGNRARSPRSLGTLETDARLDARVPRHRRSSTSDARLARAVALPRPMDDPSRLKRPSSAGNLLVGAFRALLWQASPRLA